MIRNILSLGFVLEVKIGDPSSNSHENNNYPTIVSVIIYHVLSLAECVKCSPMIRETELQSQVDSYQRLKKCYFVPPCLTLSIIRYGSRVKWSNPVNGVAPFPTPRWSSYWKGNLRVAFDWGRQLYLLSNSTPLKIADRK